MRILAYLKHKYYLLSVVFICGICHLETFGQFLSIDTIYKQAYDSLDEMLASKKEPSFKKAVFITEKAFGENQLSYDGFCKEIQAFNSLANKWIENNKLSNYKYLDSLDVLKSYAVYAVLKDTLRIKIVKDTFYTILPCTYDFDDFLGQRDWTKMFVTKLLNTNSGNCHSMPYLYKILADELGLSNVWLSFAPNHIYIKNRCQKTGWYNTELTSGQFPVDAWITASGYISMDAIRSGIYMDTISNRQAVANCVFDLAKGYERKTYNYADSFIVRCCDLVLRYHSKNINAIIYKAETLKKMYMLAKDTNPIYAESLFNSMEVLYLKAMDSGYKQMPEKMYRQWLESVIKQKGKYNNQKVISVIKARA